jgi:hypothetical protein
MKHIEKEWKNLQNVIKSAANESLGTIKKRIRRKYLKIWDDQIKQLIETKKTSYKKWLNSKKLEDKLEYKRNTALANLSDICCYPQGCCLCIVTFILGWRIHIPNNSVT